MERRPPPRCRAVAHAFGGFAHPAIQSNPPAAGATSAILQSNAFAARGDAPTARTPATHQKRMRGSRMLRAA
jgi:hypothetical protein